MDTCSRLSKPLTISQHYATNMRRQLAALLILIELRVLCFDLRFLRVTTVQPTAIEYKQPTIALSTSSPLKQADGEWSEWKEVLPCNKECGSCGTQVFRRTCVNPPCRGNSRKEEPCNIQVCHYPDPSCCPPFELMLIEGEFACGPQQESVVAAFVAKLQATSKLSIKSHSPVLSKASDMNDTIFIKDD